MSENEYDVNKRYKVGRVLSEDGLDALHDRLPSLWTGEGDEQLSLRELADRINSSLVRRAMERAGEEPLEGEAESAYQRLTADDVTAGVRTQQRNRLERAGIDVAQLEADFVTHQAVYTYLTEALDVAKEHEDDDPLQTHEQRVQRLRSRTVAVTENSLSILENVGHLSLGPTEVVVDINVYCRSCGRQYEFSSLLQEGGCACE